MNDQDMTCKGCGLTITASSATRVQRLEAEYNSIQKRGLCVACFWQKEFDKKAKQIKGERL